MLGRIGDHFMQNNRQGLNQRRADLDRRPLQRDTPATLHLDQCTQQHVDLKIAPTFWPQERVGPGEGLHSDLDSGGILRRIIGSGQPDDAFNNGQSVHCPVIDFPKQPVLGGLQTADLARLGDIALGGENVQQLSSFIADRAQMQLVPERRSVLAIVENLDVALLALANSRANLGNGPFRGFPPL